MTESPDHARLTDRRTTDRRTQVVELRRTGLSFTDIGRKLGITRQTAHELFWAAMDDVKAHNVAAMRQQQTEILEWAFEKAAAIANKAHVAVSGGTIVKGEDGQPLVDDGPTLRALAEVRAIQADLAKLHGTLAPVQATINGEIRYEIGGLTPDQLEALR